MAKERAKLTVRFACLVGAVLAAALALFIAWSVESNDRFAEEKALTEAKMLNLSIESAWNYIDDSQNAINYNADGSYDFKHIYCSIAGKNIANRITGRSDGYVVRYARANPRSGTDAPDAFEQKAIDLFENEPVNEFYEEGVYEGEPVLRFASRLSIENNCLTCHGEPAGTLDETGFLREGMQLGDLAGITSIVVPLSEYRDEAVGRAISSVVFFTVLAVVIIVSVRLGLKRWVERPLEESNSELVELNRAQSDFLATMSHELRTPLSSIIAFTDLWEKEAAAHTDKEKEMVAEVKQNSRALLTMVNNTIDAAKLEAGLFQLRCEETDLVDVVDSAISSIDALASKHGVILHRSLSPELPMLSADPFALQKVLVNLLANAVQHSGEGDVVEVSAHCDGDVVVKVRDEGCGIAPDQLPIVFNRFRQAEGERAGSGLGLYVVKTLVESHGGTVEVESALGEGAVFTVRLPVSGEGEECSGEEKGATCE